GIGITAQLNKKHNVYLDIERASGGQFSQPWSVNGGYRFNW
ncbi:MAG: autotransporter outer membrane beta-barrel domain-containing protein, partial [Negativicutes bacterium]|nr:autotransporter outer membrane beta-barrel domain-containing protein [Negativicutes bacterium]